MSYNNIDIASILLLLSLFVYLGDFGEFYDQSFLLAICWSCLEMVLELGDNMSCQSNIGSNSLKQINEVSFNGLKGKPRGCLKAITK